jgi:enoyl-CoA hydratase/carnithine racemase
MTGLTLDATTAERIGLVHEVAPGAEVLARSTRVAQVIASRAQVSVRGGKAMIARVTGGLLDEDDTVRAVYAESLGSAEYAEGVDAFVAKREPDFRAARRRP